MSDAPERIWIPEDPNADMYFSIVWNEHTAEYVRADVYDERERQLADCEHTLELMSVGVTLAISYLPDRPDDVRRVLDRALELYRDRN